MNFRNYPAFISCRFLGKNFYEQISNAFEEHLSEALFTVNSFLLKSSDKLLTVDDDVRHCSRTLHVDERFSADEFSCDKLKAEATENLILIDESKGLLNDVDSNKSSAVHCEESDVENVTLDNFDVSVTSGDCELLEVPILQFELVNTFKTLPNFHEFLKILPAMELDDDFPQDSEEFYIDEKLLLELENSGIVKISSTYNEEELSRTNFELPELSLENTEHFPNESGFLTGTSECLCLDLTTENAGVENSLSSQHQSEYWESASVPPDINAEVCALPISISDSHLKESSTKDALLMLEQLKTKQEHFSDVQIHETSLLNCDYENKTVSLISQNDLVGTSNEKKLLNNDAILSSSVGDNSIENNFETACFDSFDDVPEEFEDSLRICVPDHSKEDSYDNMFVADSCNDNVPLLQKLSNLEFERNVKNNENLKSILANNISSCTAKRQKQVSLESVSETQFSNTISKMPSTSKALANTLNNNLANQEKKISASKKILDKRCENVHFGSYQMINAFVYYRQNEKENSALNTLPIVMDRPESGINAYSPPPNKTLISTTMPVIEIPDVCLEAEDLFVTLPDECLEVLVHYETAAIPSVRELMKFKEFKFPSNYTIVDISSQKTCFLLNQEVKKCKDENIDLFENETRNNYYSYLLKFHGILKSLEIFVNYDLQVAVDCIQEFKLSHQPFLKRAYDDLIRKLCSICEEFYKQKWIHPKITFLCNFLGEKHKFCMNYGLQFKVLIIVKKNLKFVFQQLESQLQIMLPPVMTTMIPDNVYLQPTTSVFESAGDSVYIIDSSSICKKIPWKNIKLVVEFEYSDKSYWKKICGESEIPHAFIKVVNFPLKKIAEIEKMKITDKTSECMKEVKQVLIVLSTLSFNYQLLYLLESRGNFNLCIRPYEKLNMCLEFADIVVNEKSGVILLTKAPFLEKKFVDDLIGRITSLQMKYETCWVILQEYADKNESLVDAKNCHENYIEFCCLITSTSQSFNFFKVKLLNTYSVEETVKLIRSISSSSSHTPSIKPSTVLSNEELFLLSFPSLNPYVVQLLIAKYTIEQILNLSRDELIKIFFTVPARFLKDFYQSSHKSFVMNTSHSDIASNTTVSPSSFYEDFMLQPEPLPSSAVQPMSLTYFDPKTELDSPSTSYSEEDPAPAIEKSLEELDLDYFSMKLGTKFEDFTLTSPGKASDDYVVTFNSSSSNVSPASKKTPSSSSTSSYSSRENLIVNSLPVKPSTNKIPHDFTNHPMLKELFPIPKRGLPLTHSDPISQNVQNSLPCHSSNLTHLRKFMFAPKKRGLSSEDKLVLSPFKKRSRTRKGISSQTVSKQDLFLANSSRRPEITFPLESISAEIPAYSATQPFTLNNRDEESFLIPENRFSISQDNYFPMTPSSKKQLKFERTSLPHGQTRLVFK